MGFVCWRCYLSLGCLLADKIGRQSVEILILLSDSTRLSSLIRQAILISKISYTQLEFCGIAIWHKKASLQLGQRCVVCAATTKWEKAKRENEKRIKIFRTHSILFMQIAAQCCSASLSLSLCQHWISESLRSNCSVGNGRTGTSNWLTSLGRHDDERWDTTPAFSFLFLHSLFSFFVTSAMLFSARNRSKY